MATTPTYYCYNALTRILTAEPRYIVTEDVADTRAAQREAAKTNEVTVIIEGN